MRFLYALTLLLMQCDGCILNPSPFAADLNNRDTAWVEIYNSNDLGGEKDTVREIIWTQSGSQWYLRCVDSIERRSDREPKIIRRGGVFPPTEDTCQN